MVEVAGSEERHLPEWSDPLNDGFQVAVTVEVGLKWGARGRAAAGPTKRASSTSMVSEKIKAFMAYSPS